MVISPEFRIGNYRVSNHPYHAPVYQVPYHQVRLLVALAENDQLKKLTLSLHREAGDFFYPFLDLSKGSDLWLELIVWAFHN